MKNTYYLALILLSCMFFSCKRNTEKSVVPVNPISYSEKAKQTFDLIQKHYKIDSLGLYLHYFPKQEGDRVCSDLWSLDGLLTGVNQLKALGYTDAELDDPFSALDKYYDTIRRPAAYPGYPPQFSQEDRFYDDNAIVAVDLIENYEITGNKAALERTEEQVKFSLTGEDNACGGGMYWVEQYRNKPEHNYCIKAVCASVYTTQYLLKLYKHTKNESYLQFALKIYTWLNEKMQDPADKLFWNDIRIRDNYITVTKWTYNSGAMISNNVLLYEITNDSAYLNEAAAIASSSYKHFVKNVEGIPFFPCHDTWFNVCLFRGYLDLLKYDKSVQPYVDTFIANADYAWENARNKYGLFYEDWSGYNPGRDKWLLQQAALVEAYARIALLKGEKK